MKPIRSPKPGCRLRRFWGALFGAENPDHLARCEDCRAFAKAGGALEASLRNAARALPQPSAPFLEQRILRAIERPPVRAAMPWKLLLSTGLGAGAAVAALIFSMLRQPDPAPAPPALAVQAERSAVDVWSLLPPKAAEAILNAEPLRDEAQAVYADTQSAMHFLAANFLPPAGH